MPKISVVMACYNEEKLVSTALDSIFNQGIEDIEVLFVDDGSTDASCDIARSYDNRVRILQTGGRKGSAFARNLGIKAAKGEFIAILDCDDYWLPSKLTHQIALMAANPALALTFTNAEILYSDGQLKADYFATSGGKPDRHNLVGSLLSHFSLCHSTVMLRRELLDNNEIYDEKLTLLEDFEFCIRLIYQHAGDFLDQPYTVYLSRKGSQTDVKSAAVRPEALKVLRHFQDSLPEFGDRFDNDIKNALFIADVADAKRYWQEGNRTMIWTLLLPHVFRARALICLLLSPFPYGIVLAASRWGRNIMWKISPSRQPKKELNHLGNIKE